MADEMMDERFIGNDSGFVVSIGLACPSERLLSIARCSKKNDVAAR